jgi:FemAB-related protein (PEP-CTERM system-associated)
MHNDSGMNCSIEMFSGRQQLPKVEWDEYVERHPHGTVYHLSGWNGIIAETFGHVPYYFVCFQNKEIAGIAPFFLINTLSGPALISMPYLNQGGALANNSQIENLLVSSVIQLAVQLKVKFVLSRNGIQQETWPATATTKMTFILDISGSEQEMLAGFRKQVRNRIRKGEKEGLITRHGMEQLDSFYRMFSLAMREHGTPVMPKSFFSNVAAAFPERTSISTIYNGDVPIGGKLGLILGKKYYFIWGGYPKKFRSLAPNYYLTWQSILKAKLSGATEADFGRSSPGSGPSEFKENLGAVPSQLFWQYYLGEGIQMPDDSPANPKYRLAIGIWKRLPLAVTDFIGPKLIRRIP